MKSLTKLYWAAICVVVVGAALPASAQDPATRTLVAACFTCHGTEGKSVGNVPPALAGLDRNYLLQTMKDFKAGKRPATIMHQQAKGYTDQELETIASYFAAAKPGAAVGIPASRY